MNADCIKACYLPWFEYDQYKICPHLPLPVDWWSGLDNPVLHHGTDSLGTRWLHQSDYGSRTTHRMGHPSAAVHHPGKLKDGVKQEKHLLSVYQLWHQVKNLTGLRNIQNKEQCMEHPKILASCQTSVWFWCFVMTILGYQFLYCLLISVLLFSKTAASWTEWT